MTDVTVRHCTIRIVRHGGWGWETEPRDLLNRVLARLPGIIADEMEELWPDDEERNISAPIQLRIPVSLAELRTVADPVGTDPARPMPNPQLRGLMRAALNQVSRARRMSRPEAPLSEAKSSRRIVPNRPRLREEVPRPIRSRCWCPGSGTDGCRTAWTHSHLML
jgi:hypothetical protein